MRWLTRLGKILAVAVLAVAVGVALIFVTHPRDEEAFLDYHRTYPDITGARQADQLLAEGDAACDWLNDQVGLVAKPLTRVGTGSLLDRYVGPDRRLSKSSEFRDRHNGATASVAWDELCGGTKALIQWTHVWQGLSSLNSD